MSTTASEVSRKRAPVYTIADGEFMLNASVKDVWPHVVNYPSWQNFSIVQHVSGKPGQEGEVVLLKKEEAGSSATAYFARTIKLEPERRVIWKTFRENVEYFGIVEFRVQDVAGMTRFSYSVIYEHVLPYEDESELETFGKQNSANFQTLFAAVFPKLRKLVEPPPAS